MMVTGLISCSIVLVFKEGIRVTNFRAMTGTRCLLRLDLPFSLFLTAETHLQILQVNLTTVFTLCRDVGAHMLGQEPNAAGRRGSIINVASLLSFQWVFFQPILIRTKIKAPAWWFSLLGFRENVSNGLAFELKEEMLTTRATGRGGFTVPAYAASKGGVSQLTKALSNEWAGKGVAVNAIAPGYVATEMNTALMEDENRAKSILARIPAGRWGTPEDYKGPVLFLASAASQYISGECLVVDGGWLGR